MPPPALVVTAEPKSGACTQRGFPGTWEALPSPPENEHRGRSTPSLQARGRRTRRPQGTKPGCTERAAGSRSFSYDL